MIFLIRLQEEVEPFGVSYLAELGLILVIFIWSWLVKVQPSLNHEGEIRFAPDLIPATVRHSSSVVRRFGYIRGESAEWNLLERLFLGQRLWAAGIPEEASRDLRGRCKSQNI